MPYLSLYRKYRSQSFEELAGQEHVTRTLQNAVRTGRVAHAYLFSGPRGTGKTSSARLLARALNCERGPTPTPCGECVACQEIREGVSPSVLEIDAASSRGIDEVRELRQRAMTVPSQPGARKVFIVDEVHMLTTEACNALLKTLEEPPAHVLFVLATTDAQKLPATILSRCQRFEFRRGSVGVIGERVRCVAEAEGFAIEPEAVRLLARASGGSWRDAISLLEQAHAYGGPEITAAQVAEILGAVGDETLFELAEGLAGGEGRTVYPIVEAVISNGTEPRQLARDLSEHFRSLLMAEAGALPTDTYGPDVTPRLLAQAVSFGTGRLVAALEALSLAEKEMRWSDSGRVVLEVALARLMLPREGPARQPSTARSAEGQTAAGRVADRQAAPTPAPGSHTAKPASKPRQAVDGQPTAEAGIDRVGPADSSPKSEPPELDPFENEEVPPLGTGSQQPRPRAAVQRASLSQPSRDTASDPALDQVLERWNVIVEELKRKRAPTTCALLSEAQPVSCVGDVLVLGFRFSGHRELWDRGDNKARLAAALEAVLGRRLEVRSETLGDDAAPAPPAERRQPTAAVAAATKPGASAPPSPAAGGTLEGEALLHEAIAVFEGHIVEATD